MGIVITSSSVVELVANFFWFGCWVCLGFLIPKLTDAGDSLSYVFSAATSFLRVLSSYRSDA